MEKVTKDTRVFFRLTQEEKEIFNEDAKVMGCKSLSDYIRKMLYTGHTLADRQRKTE